MADKHILVAGGAGVVGRTAIDAFQEAGWPVTTLNRDDTALGKGPHIPADLLDPNSLDASSDALKTVTHLFYAALKPNADPGVEADENGTMLENLVAALRRAGAPLERVTFIQGGKVYGAQLGVYKTPAREDDSRHFPPNLYFRHENFARSLEKNGIRWTALRPDIVIGHSLGSAMNLGNLIGVYGSLCRATGTAFQFPGTDTAYRDVLVNVTGADVLRRAALWSVENEADGAYNITNGDVFRWSHVWPKLAEWFGLEVGEPQPISLEQRLHAMRSVWSDLAKDNGLAEADIDRLAPGAFGDFIFNVEADAIFDLTKARRAGFEMNERSDEVLLAHLDNMRQRKLIP
ncbi:SDR family oxidoreductase [Sphingobium sp. HWE2-09]|uniref:SDR family oxidoreductase n=1 Tax=Sphingobium sp. HWE2-09 TaxID=3108390 RepID=UPI002DD20001|nr:SDR family oxidoreductase [Sphingobium sp. HWE2-09]